MSLQLTATYIRPTHSEKAAGGRSWALDSVAIPDPREVV